MQGMNGLFGQVKKMQEDMVKAQEELARMTVEGSSGGGMVKVSCSGKQEIIEVKIEKDVVNPDDIDMLEDLIMAAVNDSLNKSRTLMEERMGSIAGGLNIPGLSGLNIPGL